MSTQYTWLPNNLKPGTYYARVVPSETVRIDEIVKNIGERTLVQPVDVHATLDALDDEVADALIAGRAVILDDLLGFSVSLELKDPDGATDPQVTLTPDDVIVRVNASVKPSLVKRIADQLQLAQVTTRVRIPQPQQVYDHITKETGQYTSTGVIDVNGKDLDLPDDFEQDLTQGVFFVNGADAIRAEVYINEGNKTITCMVPSAVSGTVAIEVRTKYRGEILQTGKLENITQA